MRRNTFLAVLLAVIMALSVLATGVGLIGSATTLGHTVGVSADTVESEYPATSTAPDVLEPEAADSTADEPAEEPALFAPTTLGGVVGALVLALLVVALVRRADR